jgi:hypothetical protein
MDHPTRIPYGQYKVTIIIKPATTSEDFKGKGFFNSKVMLFYGNVIVEDHIGHLIIGSKIVLILDASVVETFSSPERRLKSLIYKVDVLQAGRLVGLLGERESARWVSR